MIVRFDPRGTGLSQRELSDEQLAQAHLGADIGAVVDDLSLERLSLLGCAVPGTAAVCLAAERPELVDRLILISLGHGPDFVRYPQLKTVLAIAKDDWKLYTETWARIFHGRSNEQDAREHAELMRRSHSQDVFVRSLDYILAFDITTYLPRVRARTLVMNDARGRVGSRETARLLASNIKDARFVQYARGPFYESEEAQTAIEEFLAETTDLPTATALHSGTAVILFADIADSTALTERLGDAAFREKARELDEALRRAIASNGGTAIDGKLLGDGVLATFGAAREAIACAGEMHRLAGAGGGLGPRPSTPDPILLHVGIHAGDVIREEGNIFGGAVNIASRVADAASPGEVLVSGTVRELARTSAGVSFEDRGERELKGVGEPVRLYEVRWRE
jgi:class 3 adenylate cyclase/pimeloyl-ACP methyl ester carboxylesterase